MFSLKPVIDGMAMGSLEISLKAAELGTLIWWQLLACGVVLLLTAQCLNQSQDAPLCCSSTIIAGAQNRLRQGMRFEMCGART